MLIKPVGFKDSLRNIKLSGSLQEKIVLLFFNFKRKDPLYKRKKLLYSCIWGIRGRRRGAYSEIFD